MKQTNLIILILLLSINVSGQILNVDSLIAILDTNELNAERKMELYRDISQGYMQNDQEKFREYVDKGLELANQEKNKNMLTVFNSLLGVFYTYNADYDTALFWMEKALELSKEEKNKNLEAKLYVNIALVYSMKGEFKTEIEYNLKALSIYEEIDDKKGFITLLVNLGTTYRSLKDLERAIYYFDRADQLANETNYNHGKLIVSYAYANIYHDKKEIDESLKYYMKSLNISREENNKHFEALCAQSIATVYAIDIKDLAKAEKYANESLQVATEFGDPFKIRGSLRILAHIYLEKKRYEDCDDLATKAWSIDSIDIDTSYGLASMITKSNIHLNNKEKAEYFFNKYVELNGEKTYKNLQETLIEMEVKYETEKKETQIATLKKEKRLYISLGIAGLLLTITLLFLLYSNIKNTKKEKLLIATRSVLDGEMSERNRLARDLHDRLGGNLSAVKIGLVNSTESLENICQKLDSCIDEIRRVAHNLMPVSLQFGLKVALKDYAVQFPNVHFHFFGNEKRIGERKEFIMYCCANELVNNSLKHSGAETINLQLVQDNNHITLTVQDDGCGFDEKTESKGVGLKNIRDRILSCNGRMDIITSPGKGTETTIELRTDKI